MINNITLKEIGEILMEAESILIFPHTNPDGDAMGSSAALCRALRSQGKTAYVLLDGAAPEYLNFLDTEFCTDNRECVEEPDVCIAVDCNERSRFSERAAVYDRGKKKISIDHHNTPDEVAGLYYVDNTQAATAMIIYRLIKEMDIELNRQIAESLYVGINTDTGSFKYSNTTSEVHHVVAELFDAGIDHVKITVNLYQNISRKKMELEGSVLDKMTFFHQGTGVVSYVTEEMLKSVGAEPDDAEGMIDKLRDIKGVEIAGFLKENGGVIKVSMRAKTEKNVDAIAQKFGGGGHSKAAGFKLRLPMEEAVETVISEIDAALER